MKIELPDMEKSFERIARRTRLSPYDSPYYFALRYAREAVRLDRRRRAKAKKKGRKK